MTNKATNLNSARRHIGSAISAARYALAGLEALHADPCPDAAQAEVAAERLAKVCETASVHALVASVEFELFGKSE